MTERLVVVTPWYPTEENPYHGVFVRDTVAALATTGERPLVIHLQNLPPEDCTDPVHTRGAIADVLRIPVAVPPHSSRQDMARAQRDALREHAGAELASARAIHAHVGIPAGWAAAQAVDATKRLVVTEHATYVKKELRTHEGAQMYGEMLARVTALLTVSEMEARRIRAAFPSLGERVTTLGNPVRGAGLTLRPQVPHLLDRWLYVGNLIERKGVVRLVRAFAAWRTRHPDRDTHLTLVGSGELEAELRALANELSVADAVSFPGPCAPDELNRVLHDADVLVHLSSFETFGLTVVEAALTGLPVLVTACGGPEETLREAASAGIARFVPVEDDPASVVDGLVHLESTIPAADVSTVRDSLLARYGESSYGAQLKEILDGAPAARPIGELAPQILAISLSPKAHRRMQSLVPLCLHAGIGLTVVTNLPGEAAAIDTRVRVIDLSRAVVRSPLHWPELVILRKLPRAILLGVQRAVGLGAGLPGAPGRISRHFRRRVGALLHRHTKVADAVHRRILHPYLYSYVDPWITSRNARDRVLRALGDRLPDRIVMGDNESRTLAWHLGKQWPDVPIGGIPGAADLWALHDERAARATPAST
jgi:glycosyltransferase involved in cell wall biosynthesis